MKSHVIEVMPKRVIDCSGLSASGAQDVSLVERIDSSEWLEATMKVRIHSHNVTGSNYIAIVVSSMGWTPEDPGIAFVPQAAAGFVTILSSTPSPGELDVALSPVGATARIHAQAVRISGGTPPLLAVVSIEVSIKA